ncbi:MAG: ACP S-malonyltransferase [Candidatus Dormibacteraceae bacterium]
MGLTLAGPVALLFPGQGVQEPGMGQNLYERHEVARRVFERAEAILEMPIRQLCFEGPADDLNRTQSLQPAVMTVCWAAYEVYRERFGLEGVRVMAGHSLGEIAALAASGAVPWKTALILVKERGRLMARAAEDRPGGMIAIVGLSETQVSEIRDRASERGEIWIANRNADAQFVLSGEHPALQEAERLAVAAGARRALILTIPLPAHSPLMEGAAAAFKRAIDRLSIRTPRFPILGNATGEAIATVEALRQELAQHLLRPVDWARTMVSLQLLQIGTVVELGPGRVLASLAAKHIPGIVTWNAEELLVEFAEA